MGVKSTAQSINERFAELPDPRLTINRRHLSVDVKDAVVTIDAMGCQKAIARLIVERGANCILPVKGNQDRLQKAVEAFFDEHLEDDFARLAVSSFETEGQSHGRLERRRYLQVNLPQTLAGHGDWAGLRTLGIAIRTPTTGG